MTLCQLGDVAEMNALNTTIVALGDSTTAGTPGFRSPLEAPPAGEGNVESQYAFWLMRARPEWRVLNRGVNGERSDQIRARFARDVLEADADLVVIIAGVNDIYQGRSPEQVEARARGHVRSGALGAACDSSGRRQHHAVQHRDRRPEPPDAGGQRLAADLRDEHADIAFCDTRLAVSSPSDPDRLLSSPDDLHPSPRATGSPRLRSNRLSCGTLSKSGVKRMRRLR